MKDFLEVNFMAGLANKNYDVDPSVLNDNFILSFLNNYFSPGTYYPKGIGIF